MIYVWVVLLTACQYDASSYMRVFMKSVFTNELLFVKQKQQCIP